MFHLGNNLVLADCDWDLPKIDPTTKNTLHPWSGPDKQAASAPGCRTGNGEKLISSQAEAGQAIKSAVA